MTQDKKKAFLVNVAYAVTLVALVVFFFRHAFYWLLPFILGFVIAFLLRPVTSYFIRRAEEFNRKGIAIAVITVFYIGIGVLIWLLVMLLVGKIGFLIGAAPQFFYDNVQPALVRFAEWATGTMERLSSEAAEATSAFLTEIISRVASSITSYSARVISQVTGMLAGIPMFIVSLIFTIVCSVFISADYEAVTGKLLLFLPENARDVVSEARQFITGTLMKMIRSYILIFFITFVELAVCLVLIHQSNALLLSALIALFDILPFFGTGGIVLPWAVVSLAMGNTGKGVALLVIYLIVTVVRNIIEPRIVGQSIGLHPIVTITSMYAGLKIAGFAGFIGLPVAIIFLKYLHREGKIYLRVFDTSGRTAQPESREGRENS